MRWRCNRFARKDGVQPVMVAQAYNAARRRRAISWLLVIVWAGVIFYMSSRTGSNLSSGFFGMVKEWATNLLNTIFGYHEDPLSPICHFFEYLVLGMLLCNALGMRHVWGEALLLAIVIASAYGVTDEIHQIFVPERMCDPLDWLTDTCGATLGAAIWAVLRIRHGF